jgi:hypothetical protein
MTLSQSSARRKALRLSAEEQRAELSQIVDQWREPLRYADHGLTLFKYVKQHPYLSAGGSFILLNTIKLFRFHRWFSRSLVFWQLIKKR